MTAFTTWFGFLTLAQGAEAPGLPMLPMIVMFLVFFYLVVIRPQRKESSEKQSMLDALKKGDTVLTSSGMYGTVVSLKGDEVLLRIDEQNKVKARFVKAAIARVVEASEGAPTNDAESVAVVDEANKS